MKKETAIKKRISKGPFSAIIPSIPSLIFDKIEQKKIKKIYLFGSYAYGKPNKDSDVDICVIINNNLVRLDVATEIKTILRTNNIVPSDLLVFRNKEFLHAIKFMCIEQTIAEKGMLLYG